MKLILSLGSSSITITFKFILLLLHNEKCFSKVAFSSWWFKAALVKLLCVMELVKIALKILKSHFSPQRLFDLGFPNH